MLKSMSSGLPTTDDYWTNKFFVFGDVRMSTGLKFLGEKMLRRAAGRAQDDDVDKKHPQTDGLLLKPPLPRDYSEQQAAGAVQESQRTPYKQDHKHELGRACWGYVEIKVSFLRTLCVFACWRMVRWKMNLGHYTLVDWPIGSIGPTCLQHETMTE